MENKKLFNTIMEVIYDISRVTTEYESVPRKYGTEDEIFMVEAHTLNLIGDNENITMTDLVNITKKTKGAISQMIDKLIKKGMVCKTKDANDQRKSILSLTEKGKIIYDYHKKLDEREYGKIFSQMEHYSMEELKLFLNISTDLLEILKGNSKKF